MIPITFSIPSNLAELTRTFESWVPGSEFRLVGGCLRDLYLGRTPKDWDIITDADPAQLEAIGLEAVGAGFPVYLYKDPDLGQVEIACCRTERKVGTGHNGFEMIACKSFEEDAFRRDLTINACSWHHSIPDQMYAYTPQTEADFKSRTLRAMSPAFKEDPLRVLRVARFAAQLYSKGLDFWKVDAYTQCMMYDLQNEVEKLPPDRVRMELEGAMFKGEADRSREAFFTILEATGNYDYWFEELCAKPVQPILIADHPYKKELMYFGLACSTLSIFQTRTTPNMIRSKVKSFGKRLNLGFISEMETFVLATDSMCGSYSNRTAEEIYTLCRSMMRGKVPVSCYIDGLLDESRQYTLHYYTNSTKYIRMLEMVCLALKSMKFTAEDTPTSIKERQLACVSEFMDIFLIESRC